MTDPRSEPDEPTDERLDLEDSPEPDDRLEPDDRPVPPVQPAPALEPEERPAPVVAPGRRRTRIGTVVLGLVLAAVAATVWVDRVLERHVSLGGVATGVMIAAGALLLGGAVLRPDPRH